MKIVRSMIFLKKKFRPTRIKDSWIISWLIRLLDSIWNLRDWGKARYCFRGRLVLRVWTIRISIICCLVS